MQGAMHLDSVSERKRDGHGDRGVLRDLSQDLTVSVNSSSWLVVDMKDDEEDSVLVI